MESVVNRLHTVRSTMREHSASNEALLAAIASMVADGKSANKAGLEEAMRGLERQRKETLEAREEARRAHELLLVMESELVTVETTRRELAQAQEALARLQADYDNEASLRADMQVQINELTLRLENSERDSHFHQQEMERMCKDLLRAEDAKSQCERMARDWENATDTHDRERLAEWESLSRIMTIQTFVENAVNKAAKAAQQNCQGQQTLLSQNRTLALQLQRSQEKVSSLEQELDAMKEKNKQFAAQVKRLSEAAGSGEDDITRLRTELAQLEEKYTLLKQKDKESEKALNACKTELKEKDKNISSLAKDLDAYDYCVRTVSHSLPRRTEWRLNDLGLTIVALSPGQKGKNAETSVVLDAIIDGGPAARCEKLSAGDSLLQVNERNVAGLSLYQIQNMLRTPGNSINLTVRHATKGTTFSVTLKKDSGATVSSSVFEQINQAYKTASAWRAELHSMQGRVDDLENELGGSSSKNVELLGIKQTSAGVLTRVISDLQDSIEDSQRVITDQKAEIAMSATLRTRIKQLQALLDEEISKQQQLKKDLSTAELERTRVDEEMKLLFEKLQNDLQESEKRNARAAEHLRHQKQRADEADAKLLRTSAQVTERSQESTAAHLQLEHVTELHQQALDDLDAARAELEQKRQQHNSCSLQLSEALKALNQVHDSICRAADTQYCGVGLRVAHALPSDSSGSPSKQLVVDSLVAGGPAAACGDIVEGDPLLQVDGKSVQGMSTSEVQRLLLGSAGSTVELAAQRGKSGARYRVTLVRGDAGQSKRAVGETAVEACQAARAMHGELAEGRVELEELREEVKRLKAQVAEVHYWEGRFISLEVEHTSMEQEVFDLRDKVARLEAASRDGRASKAELEALELEMEALKRELERTRDSLSDSTRRVDEMTSKRAALQEDLDFTKSKLAALEAQLSMVTVERDRLSREVVRLSAEKATLEAMQGGQGEAKDEIARLMAMVEMEAARAEGALGREAEALAKAAREKEEQRRLAEELAELQKKLDAALAEQKRLKVKADAAEQALQHAQGGSASALSLRQQLEQRLEAARKQLEDKDAELDGLRGELERMRVALKDMTRQRDELAHTKATLLEDLDFCKGRETTLENHVSLLKLEIERLKALIQRLTEDKEQLEHTVETQEGTIADLRAALEAARVENGRLLGMVETEKKRADSAEAREAEANARIARLEEERGRLLDQLEVLKQQLEAAQMEIHVLTSRLETMRIERDELREIAKMVKVLEAERDAVQMELEKAIKELEQLRADHDQDHKRLKHEIERAAMVVREQQEVNAALRTENESLFEDLEAAKDKASTLQNEVRSANEENERLKLEISSLLQQLDEARRREGESTRRIEVLQREREQLEDELRRLRGEGEELSSVLEVAAMETQGLKGSQQQLEADLKARKDEIAALNRKIQELQVELRNTKDELGEEEARRSEAEEEAARLRAMLESKEAKLYELNMALKAERSALEAAKSEREELSADLEKERERADGLQAELNKALKELARLKAEAAGKGQDADSLKAERDALYDEIQRLEQALKKALEEVEKGQELLRAEQQRSEEAGRRLLVMEDEVAQLQARLAESKKKEEEAREERRALGKQMAQLEGACQQLNKQVAVAMRDIEEERAARALVEEEAKIEHQRNLAITVERDRAKESARVADEKSKEAEQKRLAEAEKWKLMLEKEKKKVEAAAQREETVRAMALAMYTEVAAAWDDASAAHTEQGMALAVVKQQQHTLSSLLEDRREASLSPPAKGHASPVKAQRSPMPSAQPGWRSSGSLLEELRALGKLHSLLLSNSKAAGAAEIQQLLLRLQQEESQRIELELLNQGLQARLDGLMDEVRKLEEVRKKMLEELAGERSNSDALSTKLRSEEERVAARTAEVDALHQRVGASEKDKEALKAAVKSIGKELARQIQAVKEDMSGPISFFRQCAGEMEGEIRGLGEAGQRLQSELARVKQELLDGRKLWDASRAKAGATGAALSGMAVGLGRVVGEVRAAEEETKRVMKELQMMAAELHDARERLKRAEEGEATAKEELARLQAELARMKRRAEEAEAEAARFKEELVEALKALEGEAEAARGAGEESEQAMQTILAVKEELMAAVKERDRYKEAARVAREEADLTAKKADEHIKGLRQQLRENVHEMHEQMKKLQSENDDAFSAMRMLHDQVTALQKELHRRSADFQARADALEDRCSGVNVTVAGQEGTLLAQQSELERLCGALEQTLARIKTEQQGVKMATKASMKLKSEADADRRARIVEGLKKAYERRLRRDAYMEWMGVRMHSVKLGSGFSAVRGHRYRQLMHMAMGAWRAVAGLDVWMERVAQRFATRWVVPSLLSPAMAHWSKQTHSSQRFIVARWERLAVGAAVVRLQDATRSPHSAYVSPPPGVQRLITSKYLRDTRGESHLYSSSSSTASLRLNLNSFDQRRGLSQSPPAHSFRSSP